MDYKKIGLKCGIEIHQQLETGRKLFCYCSSNLNEDKPIANINRKLRPVVGEGGGIDIAAAEEKMKNKKFEYSIYPNSVCIVETDEEPPHEIDPGSLDTALEVSILLKCIMPDELMVMRKLVIDGSNTSGFQRTAIVGFDGKIETSFGDVGITNVNIEEDSSQILERKEDKISYGLNRLGVPLIEIGTTPDVKTPGQAKELAEKIGMMLRSTGRVKRGLGTIRQDVNVSIKNGSRVEIKGAQDLNMIPKWVEYEAERQMHLLRIKNDLHNSKFSKVSVKVTDATKIFEVSENRITKKQKTFAILIPSFAGYLKRHITPTRTLGNEIGNYVKVKGGIKGIIHTDEKLEKYKLEKEFWKLGKLMKAKEGDTLMIAVAKKEHAEHALNVATERINQLLIGIPEETRRALDDGNSEYMRPLPGAARMYPETDVLSIEITPKRLEEARKNLPELWIDMIPRLATEYKISEEISNQIVRSGRGHLFEKLVKKGIEGKLVATTLTNTISEVRKQEGLQEDDLTDSDIEDIMDYVAKRKIQKHILPEVFCEKILHPEKSIEDITKEAEKNTVTHNEIRDIIKKIISDNKELAKNERAEKILMGMCMQKLRGRAEGAIVMDILLHEIKKHK